MSARITLYGRDGCHLCDDARVIVEQVCATTGASYEEISIDDDAALRERYAHDIPVVLVDGEHVAKWHVTAAQLVDALAR